MTTRRHVWNTWPQQKARCRKCGQRGDGGETFTIWCICWKMRLPRKKETPA